MQVAISTTRPFHSALLANSLRKHASATKTGAAVGIYSSAPRRYFRGLDPAVRVRLAPSILQTAMHLLHWELPANVLHADSWTFDNTVAALLRLPGAVPVSSLFIGWATASLASGRTAQAHGAHFVLDRACPHVDFQQSVIASEAAATGAKFTPQPRWFRDRQLAEYEAAERILVPSAYTANSFPTHLREKTIKAPLLGRCSFPADVRLQRNPVFTVGVVGGDPLRKGYLHLLRAWQQLALPHARLLLRTGADFRAYPVLAELLAKLPNVELLPYVPDINDFYRQCDLFVLPSVDDGFGMALFEAMSNAVPCIATTHCGSSELLTSGRDGLVVEPFSAEQLASAIETLYHSEELRQEIALAGRHTVMSLSRNDSSPLYDAAIATLLAQLSATQQTEAHA